MTTLLGFNRDRQMTQVCDGGWLLLVHRLEKLLVSLRAVHLVEQELHRLDDAQLRQDLAQYPDAIQIFSRNQQFFFAGSRLIDVDGREHALIHQAAVEMDFHVAGALEFLEDHFVHTAAGIDQAPCR